MSDVKRNEHMLPIARWLRGQINEVLARYDIPSDVYDYDILIDALCVCAVDKSQAALEARLDAVTEERNVQNDLRQIAEDVADDYKAQLATARRDALKKALGKAIARNAASDCMSCADTAMMVEDILALIAQEVPTTN